MQAYDEKSGESVNIGDTVTDFRGEAGTLTSLERIRVPGKSGKVVVTVEGTPHYNYDGVWRLEVRAE